jgi:hypothetical protein
MACKDPRWVQSWANSSLLLLLACGAAHAGVRYTVTQRDLTAPAATKPTPVAYFAQDGAVRVGAPQASRVILFKNGNIYSIDHAAHAVHELRQATLEQVRARLEKSTQQAQQKASSVPSTTPTTQREIAQRLVAQMQSMTARLLQPVTLQFRTTDRTEQFGNGTCRIWEESETDTKHLEVCVVPVERVSGGAELLAALGRLCHYYGGSLAAFGVGFGFTDPWPAFSTLKGIPVRVRVFQKGRAVSETELTDIHAAAVPASLFAVPSAYKVDHRVVQ